VKEQIQVANKFVKNVNANEAPINVILRVKNISLNGVRRNIFSFCTSFCTFLEGKVKKSAREKQGYSVSGVPPAYKYYRFQPTAVATG